MAMEISEHHSVHRTLDLRYEDLLPFFKGFSRTIEMRHLQSHLTTWWRKQNSPATAVQPSVNLTFPADSLRREEQQKRIPESLPLNKKEKRKRGKGLQAFQADLEKMNCQVCRFT
jgi:hypothetical protein